MGLDGKGRRNKGANFERRVAADLREIFPEAKRGFQTRGGTAEAPDVDGTPFYIECKAHKKVDREAAYAQALQGSIGKTNNIPVAICKDDRKPPVVRMVLGDLVYLWGADIVSDGYQYQVDIGYASWLDLVRAKYKADR